MRRILALPPRRNIRSVSLPRPLQPGNKRPRTVLTRSIETGQERRKTSIPIDSASSEDLIFGEVLASRDSGALFLFFFPFGRTTQVNGMYVLPSDFLDTQKLFQLLFTRTLS